MKRVAEDKPFEFMSNPMAVTAPNWWKIGYRPNETSTWYVPEPLIKLILYCISKQSRK